MPSARTFAGGNRASRSRDAVLSQRIWNFRKLQKFLAVLKYWWFSHVYRWRRALAKINEMKSQSRAYSSKSCEVGRKICSLTIATAAVHSLDAVDGWMSFRFVSAFAARIRDEQLSGPVAEVEVLHELVCIESRDLWTNSHSQVVES